MYCAKCGSRIQPEASFCGTCGGAVVGNLPGQGNNSNYSPQALSQNAAPGLEISRLAGDASRGAAQLASTAIQGKVITASITAAIVIAGIILYNMFFVTHPRDIVEKFFNAINEKDMNTVITCLDPQYEKLYNVSDKILGNVLGVGIKDVADLFPFLLEFQKAQNNDNSEIVIELEEIVSETISGNEAEVIVRVSEQDENGTELESGTGKISLKKFNEGWRIVDME